MEQHSFSIYDMVMAADPVVKGIMLILVLSSVACWAIVLEKFIRMRRLRRDIGQLEAIAQRRTTTDPAGGLAAAVVDAAHREAHEGSVHGEDRSDVRMRLEKAMRGAVKTELQGIETGLPFLATIGSSAPFIGLFGTVWGIMNSFAAIAQKQDTSLATVAPGIAEALFATALGLAAAIPAVMAYNHYTVKLGRAASRASTACGEIAKNVSRQPGEGTHLSNVEPLRAGKSH